jgi:hypothetical protein
LSIYSLYALDILLKFGWLIKWSALEIDTG